MSVDHTITPRSARILNCIYALLGLSLPIYITSTISAGGLSFWIGTAGLAFNVIYCTIVPLRTYQKRLAKAQAASSSEDSSTNSLPPYCGILAILAALFITIVWLGAMGLTTYFAVVFVFAVRDGTVWSGTSMGEASGVNLFAAIIAIIQCVFVAVQIVMWLAVAVLSIRERRALRAGEKAAL